MIDTVYDQKLNQHRDAKTGRFVSRQSVEFAESDHSASNALLMERADTLAYLEESIRILQQQVETPDWQLLTHQARMEFNRQGLRIIAEMCRVVALKNPLIKRGIAVKQLYVWGQGWSVKAKDETVQQVIDDFLDDEKNKAELTSHQALMDKEREQQTDGNQFLVAFVNESTGRVRWRSIPFEEIQDVIRNPDDRKDPWLYRREWGDERLNDTGGIEIETQQAYYPALGYNPVDKPPDIGGIKVKWKNPVYHIKTGGYSNDKFGISEIYDQIDWSQAYKTFLEDWTAIVRAYRKFAFSLETPGGKQGVSAAKTKFQTTVGAGNNLSGYDTNPPPIAGGVFVHDPNVQLNPVRTQGATVGAEDGRWLRLMVAAGAGLPETFYGDADVGNHATATTLDRPTELMMSNRQKFWTEHFEKILRFVLLWAVRAPQGPLRGMGVYKKSVEDGQIEESVDWGDTEAHIDIDFPPIISEPTTERVAAIIAASTLNGQQLAGNIDAISVTRMLLNAIGEDDIDEVLEQAFPDGNIPEWLDPEALHQMQQERFEASLEMSRSQQNDVG